MELGELHIWRDKDSHCMIFFHCDIVPITYLCMEPGELPIWRDKDGHSLARDGSLLYHTFPGKLLIPGIS